MKRQNNFIIISIPFIIILICCIIYQYGILNIKSEIDSIKEMQTIKIKTLQKYTDAIAQKKDLENQLQILKEIRRNETIKIIVAQTTAIASANLQNIIKGIIVGKGGTINSEKVEKPEKMGNFKIINVVSDVVFPDIKNLSDALFAMETQTPYLVVKELDIRVRNYNNPKDLLVKLKVAAITGG